MSVSHQTNGRQIRRISIPALAFSLLTLLSAIFAPLSAATEETNGDTVTKVMTAKEQAEAAEYWTPQRIAAATALPIPIDSGSSASLLVPEPEPSYQEEGAVPPSAALDQADFSLAEDDASAEELAPMDSAAGESVPLTGTAATYTSYDVNVNTSFWQVYPHRWVGKLTFNTPTGASSCSATAISGNNIVTAAHCIYDSTANVWYSNWAFTPAFRGGSAPAFGTFAARYCTVLNAWINLTGSYAINTWARYDVAVCTMNNNSSGQTLNGVVGSAGRRWDYPNTQLVFNSGYPARTYTDAVIANGSGQYLRSCTAETFWQAAETLGSGCDWGRGISGGSWMTSYKPFLTTAYVVSVNSGLILNNQNLYGAKFTSNNIVPLCAVRGC